MPQPRINPFTSLHGKISRVLFYPERMSIPFPQPEELKPDTFQALRLALVSFPILTNPVGRRLISVGVSDEPDAIRDLEPGIAAEHRHAAQTWDGFEKKTGGEHSAALDQMMQVTPRSRRIVCPEYSEDAFLGCLEVCAEKGAHIVCFNELSFPTKRGTLCMNVIAKAQDIIKRHPMFVVAGSAHCAETLYNVCPTIFPTAKGVVTHRYFKQICASSIPVPEILNSPPQRHAYLYEGFGIKIGVLICADLMDFTTVAGYASSCNLLLLPAYTSNIEKIGGIAKALAQTMRGLVVLVNYSDDHALFKPVSYWYGNTRRPDDSQLRRVGEQGLPAGAHLTLLDVNVIELQRRTSAALKEANQDLQWLFGIDGPRRAYDGARAMNAGDDDAEIADNR